MWANQIVLIFPKQSFTSNQSSLYLKVANLSSRQNNTRTTSTLLMLFVVKLAFVKFLTFKSRSVRKRVSAMPVVAQQYPSWQPNYSEKSRCCQEGSCWSSLFLLVNTCGWECWIDGGRQCMWVWVFVSDSRSATARLNIDILPSVSVIALVKASVFASSPFSPSLHSAPTDLLSRPKKCARQCLSLEAGYCRRLAKKVSIRRWWKKDDLIWVCVCLSGSTPVWLPANKSGQKWAK